MRLLIIIIFLICSITSQASEIVITGLYKGKDLYLRNPYFAEEEFCIQSIILNEVEVIKRPRVAAVRLDLSGFKINDKLEITIVHAEGCQPEILNPGDLIFTREFSFESTQVNAKEIAWSSRNETEEAIFILERRTEYGWEKVAEEKPQTGLSTNSYRIPITHKSPQNLYRIAYVRGEKKTYSPNMEYFADEEPITFSPVNASNKITFSRSAFYEVYDLEGNQIMKGTAKEIIVFPLKKGKYFLYLEGEKHEIFKR